MFIKEVRASRVDVAHLHRHHIGHKLRCGRRHGHLGDIHNHAVEVLTQRRKSTERSLKYPQI